MHKLARNVISVADIFPGSSSLSQHTFLKQECQRKIARKGRKTSTNINVSKDTFNFILGHIRHNLRGTVTEDPIPPAINWHRVISLFSPPQQGRHGERTCTQSNHVCNKQTQCACSVKISFSSPLVGTRGITIPAKQHFPNLCI